MYPLPGRGRAVGVHRAQAQAGVSAKYLASYYYKLQCWAFPEPEREAFDQVVVFGYRQAEPHLDEEAERRV